MKPILTFFCAALLASFTTTTPAQVPVVASAASHETWLASADAKLMRNKKLVYDFWREVIEAGNFQQTDKYVSENYIQHNPNIATGRAALIEQIAKNVKPQAVQPRIKAPLVSIVAEGNLVIFTLLYEIPDAKDPSKKYTTTWFDMFRIEDGKIAEHWDSALKLP